MAQSKGCFGLLEQAEKSRRQTVRPANAPVVGDRREHLSTTTILSTGDPRGIREGLGFKPVKQYPHLRGALYRKILSKDEFLGTVAVYLVVLNKLKVCAINTPLLLLSTGGKQKEFCRWLVSDAEGLTIEEQVTYQSYMIAYDIVDDEEVKRLMGRKVLRPNYDNLAELIDETFPPEVKRKFVQKLFRVDSLEEGAQKLLGVDSLEEAILKLARAKEQQKENGGE